LGAHRVHARSAVGDDENAQVDAWIGVGGAGGTGDQERRDRSDRDAARDDTPHGGGGSGCQPSHERQNDAGPIAKPSATYLQPNGQRFGDTRNRSFITT
jgi:hypothetical protein